MTGTGGQPGPHRNWTLGAAKVMQTGAQKTSGAGSGNSAAPQGSGAWQASAGPSRFKATDRPEVSVDPAEDPEAEISDGTAFRASPGDSGPPLGFKDFVWPESSTSL
jgi:hypothetical protein